MTFTEINSTLRTFATFLHEWQELAGAIIGATMGVVGAMIVALSATRNERRAACRALIADALLIKRMVHRLKLEPRKRPYTPAGWLIKQVRRYRFELSPLFESHMLKIAGVDPRSFGCLKAVSIVHGQIDALLDEMEETNKKSPIGSPDADEQAKLMVTRLGTLNDLARCADYLLAPDCDSGMARLSWKIRRRFSPTEDEAEVRKLLTEFQSPSDAAKEKFA